MTRHRMPRLSGTGKITLLGIVAVAIALLLASALKFESRAVDVSRIHDGDGSRRDSEPVEPDPVVEENQLEHSASRCRALRYR